MSLLTRCAVALGAAALLASAASTVDVAQAADASTDAMAVSATNLTLVNGWGNYGGGTRAAGVQKSAGIGYLSGAIATSGTNPVPFVLPAGYRPTVNEYVAVDMCNATHGRLLIQPSGTVSVQTPTWSNAQCFTSLEGVAYSIAPGIFTALPTINGWSGGGFGTSTAAATNVGDVIFLRGSIETTGTNTVPFQLAAKWRPKSNVYVKVDMCGASNGRLIITPGGSVTVSAESDFSNAQCFTSLDGVSYPLKSAGYRVLPTINGWTAAGFGTRGAAARNVAGHIHLEGSVETTGTSGVPFTIPTAFRPSATVYAPVDMCGATNGRLIISPTGSVTVQAESDFSNAACFTSLEGVQYPLS